MAKSVLGKGIEALIPELPGTEVQARGNLIQVEVKKVRPNPYQPRGWFDQARLDQLADSIREKGVVQPIVIREKDDGFELVVGERRLKAAEKAGLKFIPALMLERPTKQQMIEMALVENIQREDLNPIDQAKGYRRLISECGVSLKELSKRVSKDRSSVSNTLRLLNLPEKIQKHLSSGKISEGHARAVLGLVDTREQLRLCDRIVKEGLSVRKTEEMVHKRGPRKERKHKKSKYLDLENKMREYLKTSVRIVEKKGKGRIEVEFYSEEDLGRIIELLGVKI